VVGEGVKALSRFAKKNPKEGKLRRGAGGTRSKQLRSATDSRGEESPEGGRRFLRPWPMVKQRLRQERQAQRQEGNGERRARAAPREGKPLESEPRTWQWGEINPQRSLEEEAVEDVRNVEDGTKQAWDACDAAARETEPLCE